MSQSPIVRTVDGQEVAVLTAETLEAHLDGWLGRRITAFVRWFGVAVVLGIAAGATSWVRTQQRIADLETETARQAKVDTVFQRILDEHVVLVSRQTQLLEALARARCYQTPATATLAGIPCNQLVQGKP